MAIGVLESVTGNQKKPILISDHREKDFPRTANSYQGTYKQTAESPKVLQLLLYSVHNIRFRRLIPVTLTEQHGKIFIENEELEAVEMGGSYQDAIHSFVEYIADQFTTLSNYAESDRITEKARRLLNAYKDCMEFEKTE